MPRPGRLVCLSRSILFEQWKPFEVYSDKHSSLQQHFANAYNDFTYNNLTSNDNTYNT
jgi:hypothetical protein